MIGSIKKIRNASKEKIPFTLIAGGEDVEAGAVSFRYRDGHQENGIAVDRAVDHILDVVAGRLMTFRVSGWHDDRACRQPSRSDGKSVCGLRTAPRA